MVELAARWKTSRYEKGVDLHHEETMSADCEKVEQEFLNLGMQYYAVARWAAAGGLFHALSKNPPFFTDRFKSEVRGTLTRDNPVGRFLVR